jgi:pyrimidine-nucleoside phosphorylase
MRVVDLIRKKRDGSELTEAEISFLVEGATRDEVPDYQISAWLMAALLRGLSAAELASLTSAMLRSGSVLDLSELPPKKVDKHSTGGVGDKTSLILAPLVAAGGLVVPMISGRGLGHTGGTLDKLEAIPGFDVNLSLQEFKRVLKQCGCAMIGQTAEIAPADKKIYALRDVTATVESPELICASIMSKKLAEGTDALVLDVKTGSGAFMKKEADAVRLANLMVETGRRMGKRVVALITGMDQPLGWAVGNGLETEECIRIMRGERDERSRDLVELTLELAGWMFFLADRSESAAEGKQIALELLESGKALEKFRTMVKLQGGDVAVADDPRRLPQAKSKMEVSSKSSGYVISIDCEKLGVASLALGGGRERKEDGIDAAVGLVVHKKVGDQVATGEPLCTLRYNSASRLEEATSLVMNAYAVGMQKVSPTPLVRRVLGAEHLQQRSAPQAAR